MCGLAGYFCLHSSCEAPTRELLLAMRDTMVHRGPDGAGFWISDDKRVGLAHRRLSIIDLSDAAAQPMCNQDGTLWITFNGEIYNHLEVRKELNKRSRYKWKTNHSDTEMILHAFEEWGIACLDRFRGMFSFALWDSRKQELWLVRDRIGVKPMVYTVHQGVLYFASEIKALLRIPGLPRRVNEEALFHFLSFLTAPAPTTLFEGIEKLPPATWLKFGTMGGRTECRYWDVWDHTNPIGGQTEGEICQNLMECLETAVNYRKVSDVPVGVFLSGGIDSTTNAALFSRGRGGPVKAFAIGYEQDYGTYKNELHHARFAAESVGAEYYERKLTQQDLLDFLPHMVHLQDEPIADPVCVPLYYVSKLARDNGVTVCQVGEGADELFWGYPTWRKKLLLQTIDRMIPTPRFMKQLGLAGLKLLGRQYTWPYEALRRSASGYPIFWGGADYFTERQKWELLSPRLRRKLKGLSSWDAIDPIYRRFQAKSWDQSDFHWMSYLDLNFRLPELLLMRVDKMSMGVSLEGRVPFLDHEFVSAVFSIPSALKTKNWRLKYLLKKAVRGTIPDRIIDRPKQGFGVPVFEWLQDRLGQEAREHIDLFLKGSDLLDSAAVHSMLEGPPGESGWFLLNLAMWWQHSIG